MSTEATEQVVRYCICKQVESAAGVMIECVRATGGCGGWVHPACCGLMHTPEELDLMSDFICPLCEDPTSDDFKNLKATNAKRANKALKKARKKAEKAAKKSSGSSTHPQIINTESSWACSSCTYLNDPRVLECAKCGTSRYGRKTSEDVSSVEDVHVRKKRKSSHRRSKREKRKSSYHVPSSEDEDEPLQISPSEEYSDEDPGLASETAANVKHETFDVPLSFSVEKVLGSRKPEKTDDEKNPLPEGMKEYLIKWKGFSYMHASWEREDILINSDVQNKGKLRRFDAKELYNHQIFDGDEETEYFSPDFLEIHRILATRMDEPFDNQDGTVDDGKRYLVKWRSLPYAESTWERSCDVNDDAAIEQFERQQKLPPKAEWTPLPHPNIREYKKIEESEGYGADKDLKLRDYQLEGVNWLTWNYYNKRASILADEMGLGKTIQTLAFLKLLKDSPIIRCRGPFLIVAPLSLIQQWQNECDTWTDMDCVVHHGSSDSRQVIQDYEFHYFVPGKLEADKKKPYKFNILVTTYEIAIKDIRLLSKISWRCLVVDEAHRLKNHQSRLVEQLNSIRREHCVLLTGTPLQNKTEELWALLNFVDSNAFPSIASFLEKFGNLHDASQVAGLHKMLKPFLLRRVKEDVEKALPPKEETIVEVELTTVQKQWYRAIYEKNTAFLYRGGKPSNAPNLMNVMMELRKCCNHPYLNNGVEATVSEGLTTIDQRHEMLVKCCGKMVLLDKLLPRLKEGGHKVLIFSQMVRVLDILEDYMRHVGHAFERLDGRIRGNLRQAAIDRFVKPEYNRFVMLLSTKAGGLGLNLTAADTVIIFDSDWNPQNDLQAQARAHRIGQTHSVKIYRLITRKTYEMHMFHKASLKLGLDQAVLTHMRQENEKAAGGSHISQTKSSKAKEAYEIDELLKKGAYDVFREDDEAAEEFCAADIDSILQRSSKLVQYEQTARSQFSKASFVSAANDNDVDIDDPDFWKKAVGLDEPEAINEMDEFLVPSMRKRTRVSRFGAGDDEESDLDDIDSDKDDDDTANPGEKEKKQRDWTINGRDRLQRALMHFGFGRWNTVRAQCGGSRNLQRVESFARALVLQCGLCCAEANGKEGKEESAFVKGAIKAAKTVESQYFTGGATLPTVLTDTEFVTKLQQGGARRALVRLDMLFRLHKMVESACDKLDAEEKNTISVEDKPSSDSMDVEPTSNPTAAVVAVADAAESSPTNASSPESPREVVDPSDLDSRVGAHGIAKVANAIDVLEAGERPSWTLITPWWDIQADKHILMGVFLHGYGRASHIFADPLLCFADRRDVAAIENGMEGEELKEFFPEVQQINRLLYWLLSAEEIKREQEEEAQKERRIKAEAHRQKELDQVQRTAAAKRTEKKAVELVQMDILRHEAFLHNLDAGNEYHGNQPIVLDKEWSTEERRSLSYTLASLGIPEIRLESQSPSKSPKVDLIVNSNELSWERITKTAQLNKKPEQVEAYVSERYLPKCSRVSTVTVDSATLSHQVSPVEGMGGLEFVDATAKTRSHGLRAKTIALLTLRRTKLLDAARFVVRNKRSELMSLLKSDSSQDGVLPAWWRPWIHDLGVLEGMVKHGVFAWRQIRKDSDLPFHSLSLQQHVRKVFLIDNDVSPPEDFSTKANLCKWFKNTCNEFPSIALLESRIQKFCATLTQDLPSDDKNRIESPSVLDIPPTDAIDASDCFRITSSDDDASQVDEMTREFLADTLKFRSITDEGDKSNNSAQVLIKTSA